MLLWFMAILPGGAVANRNDPPCGRQPHDADQVASVRGTAADQCDCHRAYRHSEYVSCVTEVAYAAVAYGSLRPECSGALVYCAALSTCGRPRFTTRCRTDRQGRTRCSIKRGTPPGTAPPGRAGSVGP